jgi:hypothetical protein
MIPRRRAFFPCLAVLLACACSHPQKQEIPGPPEALSGGWERELLERPAPASAPEDIRQWKPVEWLRASYRSNASTIAVDAFRMPSEAVAFEARQKWRSAPGSIAFHWKNLLVVCSSSTEPAPALAEFSAKLEAEWLATGR